MQLLVEGKRALLYLDTPNAVVTLNREIDKVISHGLDKSKTDIAAKGNSFTYPQKAVRAVEIYFR